MAIERIPPRFPDPVAYSRRVGGTTPPDPGAIARGVGSPTPYLDVAGPALANTMGKYLKTQLEGQAKAASPQTYTASGSSTTTAVKGSSLDISA